MSATKYDADWYEEFFGSEGYDMLTTNSEEMSEKAMSMLTYAKELVKSLETSPLTEDERAVVVLDICNKYLDVAWNGMDFAE
jgi:hypothetical protein